MLFWNKPFRLMHIHSVPVSVCVPGLYRIESMLHPGYTSLSTESPLNVDVSLPACLDHALLHACVSTSPLDSRREIKERPRLVLPPRSRICAFGIWSEGSDGTRTSAILPRRAGDGVNEALQRGRFPCAHSRRITPVSTG